MSETTPIVTPTKWGAWLAVSPPGAGIRIGVVAESEWEARERFDCSLSAWLNTLANDWEALK